MRVAAVSDVGLKRKLNEDRFFVSDCNGYVYGFVADGMGGHQAGEIAAQMACDVIHKEIQNGFVQDMDFEKACEVIKIAFIEANGAIYKYALENSKMMGMGTTATFAMVYMDKLITAHVGDSRVYLIGDGIKQITLDHSYVQELLARGEISEEMARNHPRKNYMTRAMGTEETIKVDISINNYNNETVLICSDGLTNMVPDAEILQVMRENENTDTAVKALLNKANDNGGADNITIVAIAKI